MMPPVSKSQEEILMKVKKKSGKPFKSKEKVNTVKDIITHPITGNPAYLFYEDDSYVEVKQCDLCDN